MFGIAITLNIQKVFARVMDHSACVVVDLQLRLDVANTAVIHAD